eukprot:jgi/Ulvmu1/12472/UM009_0124.1
MGQIKVANSTKDIMVLLSVVCFGGAVGGVFNAITEPIFEFFHIAGAHGFMTRLHDPDASDAIVFAGHRVLWGGIWGLLYLLPMHKSVKNFWLRSVIFAIIPTLFALLVSIPAMSDGAGLFGIHLGIFTPLFVYIATWLTWAVPSYLWVGLCGYAGTVDDDLDTADADDLSPENLLPS